MSRLHPSLLALDKGLDLQSPKLIAEQGTVQDTLNYEQVDFQGQKRIDGYSRYDGSLLAVQDRFWILGGLPSDADIVGALVNLGDDLFGVVVNTTGAVAYFDQNLVPEVGQDLTVITGDLEGNDYTITTVASTDDQSVADQYTTLLAGNAALRDKVENLPSTIAGLHWFEDRLYAVSGVQLLNVTANNPLTLTGTLPDWFIGSDYSASLTLSGVNTSATLLSYDFDPVIGNTTVAIDGTTQVDLSWPSDLDFPLFPVAIRVRVRDVAGRVAEWEGTIEALGILWNYDWTALSPGPILGTAFLGWTPYGHFLGASIGTVYSNTLWTSYASVGITGNSVAYSSQSDRTVVTGTGDGANSARWKDGASGSWTTCTYSSGAYMSACTFVVPLSPTTERWVNCGEFDRISVSSNGKAWTGDFGRNVSMARQALWLPAYNWAVILTNQSAATRVKRTTDGLNYSSSACDGSLSFGYSASLDRLITATGASDTTYAYSDNGGQSWTTQTFPDAQGIQNIEWVESLGLWVAVNRSEPITGQTRIWTSPTGLQGDWTFRSNVINAIGQRTMDLYDPDGDAQLFMITGISTWRRSNILYA